MGIFESIKSAFSSVFSNKMRSILTMLGIIIGISSVIMITSLGEGMRKSVLNDLSKLGMESIEIRMNYDVETSQNDWLVLDDLDVLKSHPEVSYIAPIWYNSGSVLLRDQSQKERIQVVGTNEDYKNVKPINILHGRGLMEQDITAKTPVVVIDSNLSKKVFGRENSIGQTLSIVYWSGSIDYTVIGVTKAEEFGVMFNMWSEVYIPISNLMASYNSEYVDYFYATVKSTDKMDKTALELARLLEFKHNNKGKYYARSLMQEGDSINNVLGSITAFVGIVAGISLLVGGIGVMNIMLVTVTERTREIGIRKSLGATNGNINFQFLIEAMFLTAIGGIIGIVFGYIGGFVLGSFVKMTPYVSIPTVIGTVVVSSLIGICFGVYPARKAAKLDPIEALRYE